MLIAFVMDQFEYHYILLLFCFKICVHTELQDREMEDLNQVTDDRIKSPIRCLETKINSVICTEVLEASLRLSAAVVPSS